MPIFELEKAAAQLGMTPNELHSGLSVYKIPAIKLGKKCYIDDQSLSLYEARKKFRNCPAGRGRHLYSLHEATESYRKKDRPKTQNEVESLQDLDGTELLKWIDSHPETSYSIDNDKSAITIGELRDEIRVFIETYSTGEKAKYVRDIVLPTATEGIIRYIRARDANSEHGSLHELGLHVDMLLLAMAESGFLDLFGNDFESDKKVAAMVKELYPEEETGPPRTPRKQPQVYRRMPSPIVMRGDKNSGEYLYRFIVLEVFGAREPSGTYLPPSEIHYDNLLQALRQKPHLRSRYPRDPKEALLADLRPYNIRVIFPDRPESAIEDVPMQTIKKERRKYYVSDDDRRLAALKKIIKKDFKYLFLTSAEKLAESVDSHPRARQIYEKQNLKVHKAVPLDLAKLKDEALVEIWGK